MSRYRRTVSNARSYPGRLVKLSGSPLSGLGVMGPISSASFVVSFVMTASCQSDLDWDRNPIMTFITHTSGHLNADKCSTAGSIRTDSYADLTGFCRYSHPTNHVLLSLSSAGLGVLPHPRCIPSPVAPPANPGGRSLLAEGTDAPDATTSGGEWGRFRARVANSLNRSKHLRFLVLIRPVFATPYHHLGSVPVKRRRTPSASSPRARIAQPRQTPATYRPAVQNRSPSAKRAGWARMSRRA
jgi:hypothetical protein